VARRSPASKMVSESEVPTDQKRLGQESQFVKEEL
jgi:hypothetical protein